MRVLVVEDDPLLMDGIVHLLRATGYNVDAVGSAELAETALVHETFDLIVLDVGLPGMDGFEFLRRLRIRKNATHVLVLTARDALNERVRGLNIGADDYMTKPFAGEELLARAAAIARRIRGQLTEHQEHGALVIDEAAHRAWLHGELLDLPLREWAILQFLLNNVERVVSKERIVSAVCTWDQEMSENAVEVYISRLRAKLETGGIRIRTVRGLGYMLEADKNEQQLT
jgi:two-component system OmpR family response regulator